MHSDNNLNFILTSLGLICFCFCFSLCSRKFHFFNVDRDQKTVSQCLTHRPKPCGFKGNAFGVCVLICSFSFYTQQQTCETILFSRSKPVSITVETSLHCRGNVEARTSSSKTHARYVSDNWVKTGQEERQETESGYLAQSYLKASPCTLTRADTEP